MATNAYKPGDVVDARYKPTSAWKADVIVRRVSGSKKSIWVQFKGYDDLVSIPINRQRIQHQEGEKKGMVHDS